MKTDIVTTVVAAAIGVIVSFLIVSNLIIKDPNPVSIKTLTTTVNSSLDEPNVEVFNYRAVNPTVETYVDCTNYDYAGNCIEERTEE